MKSDQVGSDCGKNLEYGVQMMWVFKWQRQPVLLRCIVDIREYRDFRDKQ